MTAERIYALLLRLYPKSFRHRYGAGMTETFADLHAGSRSTNVRFWCFVLADTLRAASSQHVREWTARERRVACQWLLACACGAVLCHAIGTTLVWGYRYLYHPFLEGFRFEPWAYGAFLGVMLATTQSLVFPRGTKKLGWVSLNAMAAAGGMEIATQLAPGIGPPAYGVVVGAFVAVTQWVVLRRHLQRPGAAAFPSAVTIGTAIVGGSFALTRVLSGFDALQPSTHAWMSNAVLLALYAPTTWGDCAIALTTTAVAGLFLGAITMHSASALLSRATDGGINAVPQGG